MTKWIVSLVLLIAMVPVAQAKDLGYRYKNGKCVNEKNVEGLNQGLAGQCSDLRGVILARLPLDGEDLSGSRFDSADMHGNTFIGANLSGTSFEGADISGVDMESAILHDVKFSKANMINVHLANADMARINFSGADLTGAKLSYLDFTGCVFAGTKLTGATLDGATFVNVDLTGTDLSGANLKSAILDGAVMDGAKFENASLISASLKGVQGNGAFFKSAVMRQAILENGKFNAAVFRGAQLDAANLKNADFTNADVRGTVFTGAGVEGTIFAGAKYTKRTMLPFPSEEAKDRGMIIAVSATVILWDINITDPEIMSLMTYLIGQGVEVDFSKQGRAAFDGTMDLSNYQNIVHVYDHSADMKAAGQMAIVKFVKEGGTYIGTGQINHWTGFHNALASMLDVAFLPETTFVNGQTITLSPMAGKENHPLAAGILGATMTGNYSFANALRKYGSNEPEVIIKDAQARPVVAVRMLGDGKAINISLATSGTQDYSGMTGPTFQRLIMNAVNW